MAKKVGYKEGLRASFNHIGGNNKEEEIEEKTAVQEEEKTVEPAPEKDSVVPKEEVKEEEPEKTTEDLINEIKASIPAMPIKKTFSEEVEEFESFYLIRSLITGKYLAVGLQSNEDRMVIEKMMSQHQGIKEIRAGLIDKNSLGIFEPEWGSGKLEIKSLQQSFKKIVDLQTSIEKEKSEFNSTLDKEGFIMNIDELGEGQKLSTYLPEKLKQYCTVRANSLGVRKGEIKWLITNLVNKDKQNHPEIKLL